MVVVALLLCQDQPLLLSLPDPGRQTPRCHQQFHFWKLCRDLRPRTCVLAALAANSSSSNNGQQHAMRLTALRLLLLLLLVPLLHLLLPLLLPPHLSRTAPRSPPTVRGATCSRRLLPRDVRFPA